MLIQQLFLFLRPASATGWRTILLNFLFDFMCGRSWTHVSFLLHVKYTVSYCIVAHGRSCDQCCDQCCESDTFSQVYPSHQTHAP